MINLSRRQALLAGLSLPLLGAVPESFAQASSLRIILPIGAGSGVDAATRVMTDALSKATGRSVVIENLPGAGGITGTAQIVKAPKDGSTIGMVSNNHVVNPSVYKSLPFDSLNDITPIMIVGALPFVLVAHPSLQANTIPELLALAKAKPGQLNYASSGNGTIIHLAGAMLVSEGDVSITHVPYRATGQMVTDLLGGQVQLGFVAISVAQQHVKAGTLKALGVTTPQRSPLLPTVPTIAEQGLKDYALDGWFAAVAPAGLPPAELQRLHAAFKTALADSAVRDALLAQGYILEGSTPEKAKAFFASEVARMRRLAQAAGIQPE
jgi:tripartite-type tricarboxylate transporter receptor subunit TctC